MIRINLLPETERSSRIPVGKISIMSIAATLFLCGFVFCYHMYVLWNINENIAVARSRHETLKPVEVSMAVANTKLGSIGQREKVLAEAEKERRPWNTLISHLAVIAPSKVWFTQVGVDDKDKNKKMEIKIAGIAEKYSDVAVFINALEQDELFTEPVLTGVELNTNSKTSSTKFEITVRLKGLK